MDNNSEFVQKVVATIASLGNAKSGERDSYAIVPDGFRIQAVEDLVSEFRATPARIIASRRLSSAESFIRYVNLYGGAETIVLYDASKSTVTAIVDYHGKADPGWCEHTAVFTPRLTPEWKLWLASNRQRMSQVEFVEFIENNAPDIKTPPAAEMKQMVRELKSQRKVDFNSAVNLKNGNVSFQYTETDSAKMGKGNVEVPEEFTLRLVAHESGDPVEVEARLRYRITDGKLVMWYDLFRPHIIEQDAFDAAVAAITDGVKPIEVLSGV